MSTFSQILSIAPMMDWTNRHYRRFMREITRKTWLYTEMVTAGAIVYGQTDSFLRYNQDVEHPIVLQLGGSDPALLAEAVKRAIPYGYDEINLNVGCPSDRVQKCRFGACLMKEPALVAECLAAMRAVSTVPVTIKTRLGVDEYDDYSFLLALIDQVSAIGVDTFILHARKAWLKGLSPKENREIPPLCYERVYQVKADRPQLNIVLNGGVETLDAVATHLAAGVDGVMLGRAAYYYPTQFLQADARFFGGAASDEPMTEVSGEGVTDLQIAQNYLRYAEEQQALGERFSIVGKPLLALFQGQPGAKAWRRYLSEHMHAAHVDIRSVGEAMARLIVRA